MYTLALILLGMSAIGLLFYDQLKRNRERHRAEAWVTSQPVEALISERRKAAIQAHALLEGQIDCDDFINKFGKHEDPEIQNLVRIIESIETKEFLNEYRKSIKKRISILLKTTEQQDQLNNWLEELLNRGFRNITFPIAIINDSKNSPTIIFTLEEYALDPDLHFWPFTSDTTLIDSNGMEYNLRYKEEPGFSYPSAKIAEVDLNTVKQLIKQRLRKKKLIPIIESSQTIMELYGRLYDKYHG